ncbi:hypothetical protein [Flavobacterium phage FLiP]|uniref:Uncharacterized protein n=1 Tax=Flavobacterium phage FLiP TaxID=2023716 RepID=A0A222NP88_9VIRU|nr:hypothetical protein HOR88_gp05 [Flavobacterium phage FLiP]ASQ41227.1 hypothetical protein [Flavobacterium phage FLiP]
MAVAKLLTSTVAQSAGGIVALDVVQGVDPTSVKTQLIAIAGSLIVSAIKFAVSKWIVPLFKKQNVDVGL